MDASLRPTLITADWLSQLPEHLADYLEYHIVTGPDEWLQASYELLAAQFSVDLLDPYERYADWLRLNQQNRHTFPFLLLVAYVRHEDKALIAGVMEGNLMSVVDYVGRESSPYPLPLLADRTAIFTIGHQMSSPVLLEHGVKGIGTKVWKASIAAAAEWARKRGGVLRYAVLESEADSIGFWNKVGFRWPHGATYWQPPLEFDDKGNYLYPPVKELLMLAPVDSAQRVERTLLLNIIATLYQNWSLDAYRTTLSAEAMSRAENYVMGELFEKVRSTTPDHETLLLTEVH